MISAPITTTKVGNEIQISSHNIGVLCSSDNINKWSKKKPVCDFSATPDRSKEWWKAYNNKCGLLINQRGTYNQVIDDYKNKDNWKYEKPTGGDFPFRIADFNGYNHSATPIFTTCSVTEIAVNKFPDSSITLTAKFGTKDSSGSSLNLSDLTGLANVLYLGIMLCKKGTTTVARRCTGTQDIVAMQNSGSYLSAMVECSVYGLATGDYDVYPFLSSVQLTYDGGDVNGKFFSLPYDNVPLSTTLIETDVEIYIHGTIRKMVEIGGGTTYSLDSYCDVTYSGAGSKTFNNNSYMIRFPDKNWNDTLITDEKKIVIDNFTLQKGETKRVYENRLYSLPSSMDGNVKLWCTLSNAQYIGSTVPLRPA